MVKESTQVHVPEVIKGDRLVVPDSMSWKDLERFAQRQREMEDTIIEFKASIPVFPYEGAYALWKVMQERFGYADSTSYFTQGLFGPQEHRPESITIHTSLTTSVQVPWGALKVPGVEGLLRTKEDYNYEEQRFEFMIFGEVKKKYEKILNELVDQTKQYLEDNPLFKGQMWGLKLTSADGEPVPNPMPVFMNVPAELEDQLTFSTAVDNSLRVNLWNTIEHRDKMIEAGFPSRWGVLLAGPYGVGKTMIASVTALKCQRNGITFINAETPADLIHLVPIARRYEPAVLFCEDIDRKMPGNKARGDEHDALLNIIDGVKSKDSQLILVLTTNEVENIHPALLRPGRLDAVISVEPPDSEAVQRLIRVYGGSFVPEELDLTEVGQRLDGEKTSVVRAVVEKAKSAWIGDNPEGSIPDMELAVPHLMQAVDSMENQLDLLNRTVAPPLPVEVAAAAIHASALDRLGKAFTTGEWDTEPASKKPNRDLTDLPTFVE